MSRVPPSPRSPLRRRKPLRARPKGKGNRFEREVLDLLHFHGWARARRNFQSGGQGGGDVIEGPEGVHIEAKHRERCSIWEWIEQAEAEARPTDIPVVVFRRNRSRPYVVMPADEAFALIWFRETAA